MLPGESDDDISDTTPTPTANGTMGAQGTLGAHGAQGTPGAQGAQGTLGAHGSWTRGAQGTRGVVDGQDTLKGKERSFPTLAETSSSSFHEFAETVEHTFNASAGLLQSIEAGNRCFYSPVFRVRVLLPNGENAIKLQLFISSEFTH